MVELTIGGIALSAIISGLLELAKRGGLDSKLVPWLNVALSIVAYALVVVVAQKPDLLQPVVIVLNGIVIALSAAGVYATTKFAVKQVKAARAEK